MELNQIIHKVNSLSLSALLHGPHRVLIRDSWAIQETREGKLHGTGLRDRIEAVAGNIQSLTGIYLVFSSQEQSPTVLGKGNKHYHLLALVKDHCSCREGTETYPLCVQIHPLCGQKIGSRKKSLIILHPESQIQCLLD